MRVKHSKYLPRQLARLGTIDPRHECSEVLAAQRTEEHTLHRYDIRQAAEDFAVSIPMAAEHEMSLGVVLDEFLEPAKRPLLARHRIVERNKERHRCSAVIPRNQRL